MIGMGECVANLNRVIDRVLRPMIESQPVGAMIDFPNYSNVGDSAIYLGQLAYLRSLGVSRLDFISDFQTYDRRALAKAVDDGMELAEVRLVEKTKAPT